MFHKKHDKRVVDVDIRTKSTGLQLRQKGPGSNRLEATINKFASYCVRDERLRKFLKKKCRKYGKSKILKSLVGGQNILYMDVQGNIKVKVYYNQNFAHG